MTSLIRCCKCGQCTRKFVCPKCEHRICSSCKPKQSVTKKALLKALIAHHEDNPILRALQQREAGSPSEATEKL